MLSLLVSAALLGAPAPSPAAELSLDGEAARLLVRARNNLLSENHSAEVLWIRESFLHGTDSLRGRMDFLGAAGERRLEFQAAPTAFEWWSRARGAEHWLRNGEAGRLRRLPPHSLHKPALAGPASYEDLALFPLGYADGFDSCLRLQETDSTYEMTVVPRRGVAVLFEAIDITLGKQPHLPLRLVFLGKDGRPSRTMEVTRFYRSARGYFPAEVRYVSEDSLVSARVHLSPLQVDAVPDKTRGPEMRFSIVPEPYRVSSGDRGPGEDSSRPALPANEF